MRQNQVIAIESNSRSKIVEKFNELHSICLKPDLFSGFTKTYTPAKDAYEALPSEHKKVQYRVDDVLKEVTRIMADLFDIIATKDKGNTLAKADVVVEGNVLLQDVPASTLLFLEKQLKDEIVPFVETLPVLSEAENWTFDTENTVHKAEPNQTHRTKKQQTPLTLAQATDKFPAQVQVITEDITVGHWKNELSSGATTRPKKEAILERIAVLRRAITVAREAANLQEVEQQLIGGKILSYVFKDVR